MRQRRRIGAILFVLAAAASVAAFAAAQTRTASHAYVPQATGETGEASEVLAANQQLAQRTGSSLAVKPGAYAAALRQKARIAARGNTVAAATSAWKAYGRGPLIGDDARFSRIAFNGHADLGGRINHFAFDSKSGRLFASAGQGGVWALDRGSTTWRSIGDTLPTQAVGGVGFAPVGTNGTLIVLTGNDVFGGGTTFSGVGAYRSTDLGKTWTKASGIPNGVDSFQVAVDPTNPNVVYAATGAGLFQSTDAGKSYKNVRLPVSPAGSVPNCTGALPTVEGCYLANMVTDVVVRAPGGVGAEQEGRRRDRGRRLACRQQDEQEQARIPSYIESPGNGLYTSPTGAPGTFTKIDQANFTGDSTPIGRIELGAAVGPAAGPRLPVCARAGRDAVPGRVGRRRHRRTRPRRRPALQEDDIPEGHLRLGGLRPDVDADGQRDATLCARQRQLADVRPGLRRPAPDVLPGRAGLVQPVDRARSHAGRRQRRSDASHLRPRGGLGEQARPTRTSRRRADRTSR